MKIKVYEWMNELMTIMINIFYVAWPLPSFDTANKVKKNYCCEFYEPWMDNIGCTGKWDCWCIFFLEAFIFYDEGSRYKVL